MIDKMANGTEQMNWDIGKNDENDVLKAAQQGDSEALECLLRDYGRMVRAQAHMFTLRGTDVEDMIQEGLLALFLRLKVFRRRRESRFRLTLVYVWSVACVRLCEAMRHANTNC